MPDVKQIIEVKKKAFHYCTNLSQNLLSMGIDFFTRHKQNDYAKESYTIELASGSQYLHRGYYCPSLVRDAIIANGKRGRILKRPTDKSKATHKYYWDNQHHLCIVDKFYSNSSEIKTEYLVHEDKNVYGFSFTSNGILVGLSYEKYQNNKIQAYLYASCYVDLVNHQSLGVTEMLFEEYHHFSNNGFSADLYYIFPDQSALKSDEEMDSCVSYAQWSTD